MKKKIRGQKATQKKRSGLASDSFKRACFNWGIGRELYTAPFIWIKSTDCNVVDSKRKDSYGNIIYTCKDKFVVEKITIQDKKIVQLSIGNLNNKKRVFVLDKLGGAK